MTDLPIVCSYGLITTSEIKLIWWFVIKNVITHVLLMTSAVCYRNDATLGLAWLGLAWLGLAWLGLAWLGLAWLGLAWLGLAWLGLAWLGLAWLGLAWLGLAWLGLAWLGLAWLGLAWLGLAWLGLAWLGLAWLADPIVVDAYTVKPVLGDLCLERSLFKAWIVSAKRNQSPHKLFMGLLFSPASSDRNIFRR